MIKNVVFILGLTLFVNSWVSSQEGDEFESGLNNALRELTQAHDKVLTAKTATLALTGVDDRELLELIKTSNDPKSSSGKIDGFLREAQLGLVHQLINQNPFPQMPREQVLGTLNGQIKNEFIQEHPVVLEILTDLLRDKKAISALVKILFKKDRLKTYSFLVIGLFVFSIILNLVMDRHSKFLKKIIRRLFLTIVTFGLNIGLFYLFFSDELSPTLKIAWHHLSKTF